MTLKKIVSIGSISSISLTITTFTIIYFQKEINSSIVQIGLCLLYTSSLFVVNYALYEYTNLTSLRTKKIFSLLNFGLSLIGSLVLINILSFSNYWNIIIGLGIVYILGVLLHLLGWSNSKHSLIDKFIFSIVSLSNIFLAALFIFKLDNFNYSYLIYPAISISILALIYGFYFKKINSINTENNKV